MTITGSGFGPVGLTPSPVGRVTYSTAGQPGTVYTGSHCAVTVSDVQMVCTTTAGVGGRLIWTVVIAAQASVNPRTGYRPPEVTALALLLPNGTTSSDTGVLSTLSTRGGQTLVFIGRYLGPSSPLQLLSAAVARNGAGQSLSTTACTVADEAQTTATCVTPAGVGAGYTWSLVVAGVTSVASGDVTSFAPPTVTAITAAGAGALSGLPTAGGVVLTLSGTDFGADGLSVAVSWNGEDVPGVLVQSPHTAIAFSSPPGQGGTVNLTMTVGGQFARFAVSGGDVRAALAYAPPVLGYLSLLDSSAVDCSSESDDGSPLVPGVVSLVIVGGNFGVGNATVVTVRNASCVVTALTHTRIVCTTRLCSGAKT